MRRFICRNCRRIWFSAATLDKPCEVCNGALVAEEEFDESQTDI